LLGRELAHVKLQPHLGRQVVEHAERIPQEADDADDPQVYGGFYIIRIHEEVSSFVRKKA
jgi:hypothetical protein